MQKIKEFFTKFKNFYISNRLACTLGFSAFLLFLSTFWQPFIIFMLLYLIVSLLFFNVQEILCTTFFYLPFSGFLILFIGLCAYTAILLIAKYIIDLCKKRVKIYKLPLILTCAIVLVFSLIFYEVNSYGALQGVMFVGMFFYFYILFTYRKQIKAKECSMYFLVGLIVSAAMGAILYLIPTAQMFVFNDFGYGFMPIHDKIFLVVDEGKRLSLLTFHINHLCVYCAYAIAFVIYEYLKKETKHTLKENIILILGVVCAISAGILTLSKAFLVIFVLMLLYTFVMSVIVYRKRALKFILPVVIVSGIFAIIFRGQVAAIVDRFLGYAKFGTIISSITTGRSGIWYDFMRETFSTVGKALFGVGLFTKDVVAIGPHSLYVMVLYRLGIVGTIAFGVLIWSYIRAAGKLKYTLNSLFPMAVMLVLFAQECCIDERLYFFLISVIIAFGTNDAVEGKENNLALVQTGEKSVQCSTANETEQLISKKAEQTDLENAEQPLAEKKLKQTKRKADSKPVQAELKKKQTKISSKETKNQAQTESIVLEGTKANKNKKDKN